MGVSWLLSDSEDRPGRDNMDSKLVVLLGAVVITSGQLVDDFSCPDEFVGFYPHLISCDKYWHCEDGIAELKTCGNGLGFLDTDPSFNLEQCAEVDRGCKWADQVPECQNVVLDNEEEFVCPKQTT